MTIHRAGLLLLLAAGPVLGEDEGPPSRREFDRLARDFEEFKQDHARLEEENERLRRQLAGGERDETALRLAVEEYVGLELDRTSFGTNNVLVTGFAAATFRDMERMASSFDAKLAPIILWQPNERILFEAELEFGLGDQETEVELGYAHLSFVLNDYLTLGAGKFLLPFGTFWERWHPAWINKLPTMPLINMHGRGLVGESGLGVQLRGGAPLAGAKVNYTVYVINGPTFEEGGGAPGGLEFERNADNNNNKTVGGRVGFLPLPELEAGFSFLAGRVDDTGSEFGGVDTVMIGFDLVYARQYEALRGRVELRAEAVWTDTDDVDFEDEATLEEFTFDNKRDGWFVQLAYRPTLLEGVLLDGIELRNFEFVVRFERLQLPGPGAIGVDRERITFGVAYWILPNSVVKAAYFQDRVDAGSNRSGVVLQTAVGF